MSSYLPDDILVKVDRSAMAVGLETRIPLLDERVICFAWSIPDHIRSRDGRTKWPLRKVLERYVPSSLIDRPKQGFSVPIAKWLRDPLRPWAEALLQPRRIRDRGLLAPRIVDQAWQSFLAGNDDVVLTIWNLLMFQSWLESGAGRGVDGVASAQAVEDIACT
jgi:asparagine synthase (glutamine-hydrolysing)